MRALARLDAYEAAHPGAVRFLARSMDYGRRRAVALSVATPTGGGLHRAVRVPLRQPMFEVSDAERAVLARTVWRKLKRWLR